MMRSPELLQKIYRQRAEMWVKERNPPLLIWINREDMKALLRETLLVELDGQGLGEVLSGSKPAKIFGEKVIVSQDVTYGEPIVEIVDKRFLDDRSK
jgi:hypothetical protein